MSSNRPKALSQQGKRALLAKLLREKSGLADGAAQSDAAPRRVALDQFDVKLSSLQNWNPDGQDPFTRIVAPYKGFLYQCLGLNKIYMRGEGCYLVDGDGTRYADFVAQFGAVPFGHDPEPIWCALECMRQQSVPNLVIGSIVPMAGELAERLLAITHGLSHVAFTNSGAESVEAAIKLARCRTGRPGILSARNSFHGLTLAGMSATDTEFFQRGFGAPVAGFDYVPFGDLSALETKLRQREDYFAGFIVEVIQGESGIRTAPAGYLAAAAELCRRCGVLLIVDEAQTGLGRTGSLFACDTEGITPDILILAKALGGGIMPIGACLYTREAYAEGFELRHGSTFAGNALACRAAIATIDELTKHDCRLVREVAARGERLLAQLRRLQGEFPLMVSDVRGRGLMLGVELDLSSVGDTQTELLAVLQRQDMLMYMTVSYLLNVEHIRIGVSLTHGTVLRIEPPLTADEAMCDDLVDALRRLLIILQCGDAGALIGHLMGRERPLQSLPPVATIGSRVAHPALPRGGLAKPTRFAFVVHMLDSGDLRRFDRSLASFSTEELDRLKPHFGNLIKPFTRGRLAVSSRGGASTEGELIVLPHAPSHLLALSGDDATALVQAAVDLGADRGAEVIGLAGFSSIISYGGLAVRARRGVSVTSGNSYTTWTAVQAVENACKRHGIPLAKSTVAIVGASGAIGHALSLMFAERAAALILIGNPREPELSVERLGHVARQCSLRRSDADGRGPAAVTVTADIDETLPKAHIVLTATNAVLPFISARHLRTDALVCEVSRPFNIAPALAEERSDVTFIPGGLVQVPEPAELGDLEEPGRPNVLLACAAETVILALSGFRTERLCGRLDLATIKKIGRLADDLGFSVVA